MPTPLWFVLSTWPAEQDALYSVSSGYNKLLLLADSILPGVAIWIIIAARLGTIGRAVQLRVFYQAAS